jgi:hypothetical protein
VTAPGHCAECGAAVAEPASGDTLAAARVGALGEFVIQVRGLCDRLQSLREPHVPIAADQFAAALQDVGVFAHVGSFADVGYRLSAFDFDDSQQVGRDVRRAARREVEAASLLVRTVEEFAVFAPPAELADARAVIIEAALHGVQILETLLRALTSVQIAAMAEVQRELNELMEPGLWKERLETAEARVEEWGSPDPNARIARGLGLRGDFTDELGLVDLGRVTAVFATADDPFGELARLGAGYLRHLLRTPPGSVRGGAAGLVVPALMLCSLDRPLTAHRVALEMAALLGTAHAADAAAVEGAVARNVAELPRTLAAAQRIRSDVRYLELGLASDEDDAASRLVTTYKRLAETGFRSAAALAIDVHQIASRAPVGAPAAPPTLGELEGALVPLGRLGELLLAASDSNLRNAEGHEQYALTQDGREIVDQRSGTRWTLKQIERLIDEIVGAVVGVDAAVGCLIIDEDVGVDLSGVLTSGLGGVFVEQLVGFLLAGHGMSLISLDSRAGKVIFDAPQPIGTDLAAAVLFALAQVIDAPTVRLERKGSGHGVEAARELLLRRSTSPELQDLVYLQVVHDAERRTAVEPRDALATSLWQQLTVVAAAGLDALDTAEDDSVAAAVIERRLTFVVDWSDAQTADTSAGFQRMLDVVREARDRARGAAGGDIGELARLRMRLWRIQTGN